MGLAGSYMDCDYGFAICAPCVLQIAYLCSIHEQCSAQACNPGAKTTLGYPGTRHAFDFARERLRAQALRTFAVIICHRGVRYE